VYELYTTDVRDQLPKIHTPVLAVLADGGEQGAFRRDAATVPDHTVVVVPNTGHFVMLDDPEHFDATLDEFLRTHAPAVPIALN
jgi:pimeloyl-ACP methyl ester carboxylesterase